MTELSDYCTNGASTGMVKVVIYTTNYCPYCFRAKALLRSKGVQFEEIDVTNDPDRRAEMERLSARRTVPQIFIDAHPIGGYDDARRLDATGELDRLLERAAGSS
jgi:glutaredoxin 3